MPSADYNSFLEKCKSHSLFILFLVIAFITGVYITPDYGVSWDEPMQQKVGAYSIDYATQQSDSLLLFKDRGYGPAYEMTHVGIQRLLHMQEFRSIYLSRHFTNHLFFLLGILFVYLIALLLFKNRIAALLVAMLIYSTPRIFAHSFVNSKDIPFLVMNLMAVYTALRYVNRPTLNTLIICAIASGLMVSMRTPGILFIALFAAFLIFKSITDKKLLYLTHLFPYLCVSLFVTYASWPYLWMNPMGRFQESFATMSAFPWDDFVLFQGNYYPGPRLPKAYLPVWMSISLPPALLLLIAAGWLALIFDFLKNISNYIFHQSHMLFMALLTVVPIMAIYLFHSIIYDDWRHLYFIYPPMLLVALWALIRVMRPQWKTGFLVVLGFIIAFNVFTLIRLHPYQQTYFNLLAGPNPSEHYDTDYWGLSYHQALKKMATEHPGAKVCVAHNPGIYNYEFLPEEVRQHIQLVDYTQMEFFITTHRYDKVLFPELQPIYTQMAGNAKVFTIYRK